MDSGDLPHVGAGLLAKLIGSGFVEVLEGFFFVALDFVPHADVEVGEEVAAGFVGGGFFRFVGGFEDGLGSGAFFACQEIIDGGEGVAVKAGVGEHFLFGFVYVVEVGLAEEFPNSVFSVNCVVGVIFGELFHAFFKVIDVVVGDAESPVWSVLGGIELDHFLVVGHSFFEVSGEEVIVSATGMKANIVWVLFDESVVVFDVGLEIFLQLFDEFQRYGWEGGFFCC